jgi:hypothetical protein
MSLICGVRALYDSLGLPAQLLDEIDSVVSIPAAGLGGPLQPHVGGAVLVWEYTRQHRL